jgi:hypothetical protein
MRQHLLQLPVTMTRMSYHLIYWKAKLQNPWSAMSAGRDLEAMRKQNSMRRKRQLPRPHISSFNQN